jgi:hypothetical protein
MSDYGEERCQAVAGAAADRFVASRMMDALAPSNLELSLTAAEKIEAERQSLHRVWSQRLERAAYETARASRQYHAVEPENRLVVRQLEREWEQRLEAERLLGEEAHRFEADRPRLLTADERDAIRALARDVPELWNAPETSEARRKMILRQLVERVTIDARGNTENVDAAIRWVGGAETRGHFVRPVAKLEQLTYYPTLCQRVREYVRKGLDSAEIATRLNAEGLRPPKRRERFGSQGVRQLIVRLGLVLRTQRPANPEKLGKNQWRVRALARHIGMPAITLHFWIHRGWVQASRDAKRRWIVRADETEIERLRELRRKPPGFHTRRRWVEDEKAEAASA